MRSAAKLTRTIAILGVLGTAIVAPKASAAPPTHSRCRAATIALPLTPDAVGGELDGRHMGPIFVGELSYPDGSVHPAVWRRTGFAKFRVRDLGLPAGMVRGFAADVNADGDVVVSAGNPGTGQFRAYELVNGHKHFLHDFAGGINAHVRRINDAGVMVGNAVDASGRSYGAEWTSWRDAPVRLSPLPGEAGSDSSGINNRNQAVGTSFTQRHIHAVEWQPGGAMTVLPTFGGPDSFAYANNDRGDVVGWATGPGNPLGHATVWRPGKAPLDLGVLPGDSASAFLEISPGGRAVGDSDPSDFSSSRVIYWPGHGPLETLPPYGDPSNSTSAHAVDDNDTVIGETFTPTTDIPTLWTCADQQAYVPTNTRSALSGRAAHDHREKVVGRAGKRA